MGFGLQDALLEQAGRELEERLACRAIHEFGLWVNSDLRYGCFYKLPVPFVSVPGIKGLKGCHGRRFSKRLRKAASNSDGNLDVLAQL